jgi:hypothetical protein
MKMKHIVMSLAAAGAVMMTGCGSSHHDEAKAYNGVFVDDAVDGVTFSCGGVSGTTHDGGHFGTCPAGSTVEFSVGNLILGSSSETKDGVFFVTDIVGVPRGSIDNPKVLQVAQVLQSFDVDGDPTNGVTITEAVVKALNELVEPGKKLADIDDLDTGLGIHKIVDEAKKTHPEMKVVTAEEAEKNLAEAKEKVDNGDFKPKEPTGGQG